MDNQQRYSYGNLITPNMLMCEQGFWVVSSWCSDNYLLWLLLYLLMKTFVSEIMLKSENGNLDPFDSSLNYCSYFYFLNFLCFFFSIFWFSFYTTFSFVFSFARFLSCIISVFFFFSCSSSLRAFLCVFLLFLFFSFTLFHSFMFLLFA